MRLTFEGWFREVERYARERLGRQPVPLWQAALVILALSLAGWGIILGLFWLGPVVNYCNAARNASP
jgi:hypothetical protein